MEGNGTLTGLTPKDKADGQFIEIKITARFKPEILIELGKLFGQQVNYQIGGQQGELELEDDDGGNVELDLEQIR